MICETILDALGDTPVVRLRKVVPGDRDQIYVKLEGNNPSGSIKDRPALHMVEQAERAGLLRRDSTLVESTSGNLGKSLALVAAVRGYRTILVVDPKTPRSVLSYARSLGAELDMVSEPDQDGGFQSARIRRVRERVARIPGAVNLDQYNNPENSRAHALYTAAEVIEDFDDLGVLVASASTGGHLSGLSVRLKDHFPGLHVRAVDAVGSAIFGHPFAPYKIRGIGLSWTPGNLSTDLVDSLHRVTDIEALSTCRILARQEGLLLGESSGAVVFAALSYAATTEPGRPILAIAPDSGANYIYESYDDDWLTDHGVSPGELWRTPAELVEQAAFPTHPPSELFSARASATAGATTVGWGL
jgi:2,3-diaminopropionate biosynthesis protein SbnA